jgi:endonuclease/exonuclease/phosphatase family metal-dependent hydrolase
LRYDNPNDGENRWEVRKKQIANLIRFFEPVFIGTQEGLLHQLEYLEEELNGYQWIGVGRGDGTMTGEFSAIFYDTTKVKLVKDSDETIWLSETPSKPGNGWDAAHPRILTYGQFQTRSDNANFFIFNTHFDHHGDIARIKSTELIINKINEVTGDLPVVVTGDFNFTPDSKSYAILTSEKSSLRDAFDITNQPHFGPLFTFEGFEVRSGDERRRIDYIFINDNIQVEKHGIISTFRDNRYPSDHLPVIAEIKFNREQSIY